MQEGVRGVLHYLDDFLLMRAPGSHECSHVLAITFSTCEELGIPLAMDLLPLAFAYVLVPLSVSLPCEKVDALCGLLWELLSSKCVRDVQMLESLVRYCPCPAPYHSFFDASDKGPALPSPYFLPQGAHLGSMLNGVLWVSSGWRVPRPGWCPI